jgi:hypothetical protein
MWALALIGCESAEGGCKSDVFGTVVGLLAAAAIALFVARLLFTHRGRTYLRFLLGFLKRGG